MNNVKDIYAGISPADFIVHLLSNECKYRQYSALVKTNNAY